MIVPQPETFTSQKLSL